MSVTMSDSESGSEPDESLATTREKRGNAGNRMARLLEAEDEDEFYKTTYGGFEEEADDHDYQSENSESDNIDSDFDIDENDEVKSDDDGDEPRRKKRLVTKAYREPKKPVTGAPKDEAKPKVKKPKVKPDRCKSTVQIYHMERKMLRRTTAEKSKEAETRAKETEARAKMMKEMAARKNVSQVRRLTQEELLEEAKLTEKTNLKSLETYQRLEFEKKKARVTKQVYKGPIIRYHSVCMPLIEEVSGEPEINVDTDGEPVREAPVVKTSEKCSRTFITFTDDKIFKGFFPHERKRAPVKHYCAVTRKPAKYFDPVTQLPYANLAAFKILREAYAQQMAGQKDSDGVEMDES